MNLRRAIVAIVFAAVACTAQAQMANKKTLTLEGAKKVVAAAEAEAKKNGIGGAKEIPYEWNNVPRIVAIGDVHGAYDNLVVVLRNTGLVDDKLRWIGGKTHLVQNGDVVDRGADSRKCLELLMKLEKQAQRSGGRVHALIGNHEAMNILGFLDYVSEEEFASYRDSNSPALRERAFEIHYKEQKSKAKANDERLTSKDEAWEAFQSEYPLGYFEHRRAFSTKGRYGRWILGHNVTVRINGTVFSHGDWDEELAALGIGEVNQRVREEISGKAPLEGGITFHRKSPLQYRGLANVPLEPVAQKNLHEKVDRILAKLQARRMVVGHTVSDGVIEPRFGGKHVSIDSRARSGARAGNGSGTRDGVTPSRGAHGDNH